MDRIYRAPDREKYLVAEEIEAVLKAARGLGDVEFKALAFAANTGARPSEVIMVKKGDFHLEENRVRILTLKQKGRPPIPRDVDLSPGYVKEIASWVKSMSSPEERPFPISRITLWRFFKRAARKAKLTGDYTIYGLRHSRAIYLLEWTKDLDYTKTQMGHSSIAVTSVYLHCLPSKRESYIQSKLKSFGSGK